jgi:hypothetical protein
MDGSSPSGPHSPGHRASWTSAIRLVFLREVRLLMRPYAGLRPASRVRPSRDPTLEREKNVPLQSFISRIIWPVVRCL